jgi:hypothetical protein
MALIMPLALPHAFLMPIASAFLVPHVVAPSSDGMPGWASMSLSSTNPDFLAFDEIFGKGGMCVQDGNMPGALGYFKQALEIDPSNAQTQKMVSKFESLGIVPIIDDGAIAQARANAVSKLLGEQTSGPGESAGAGPGADR